VAVLLRAVRPLPRLPDQLRRNVAVALHEARETALALELFDEARIEAYVVDHHRRHGWFDADLAALLAAPAPSALLRVLRATRPRGERRLEDGKNGERLYLAAVAHERLNRRKQAIALYRLAVKHGPAATKTAGRERLAALKRRPAGRA